MRDQELTDLLKEFQALPKECEWVEFKVNNGNPEEIGTNLSALSNSACYHSQRFGYLVYGIENETHRAIGTAFSPKKEKKGNEELENWLAIHLNPRIDFQIFEWEFDGKHFAILRVNAAKNKPVDFKQTAYIRVGSYTKPLREHPEKERKIWNRDNEFVFEKELAKENLSDADVLSFIDYPAYFDLIELHLPGDRKGIIKRLVEDKMIIPNGGRYDIPNLGAILLAKNLLDFDSISRRAIRVIKYEGKNRTKTLKEQPGRRGYAIGFNGLIQYINDNLPAMEILLDNGLQKSVPMYPIIAIRELAANALIHQDFSISGSSPMIEIFEGRVEITNPGKPLIDILRFVDHSPQSRNETLAKFMRKLHICEERGSGIDKVIFECELYQLPAPEFIVGDTYTRVILHGRKSFREMDKQDKERACYLHACLKHVSGEYMTNQSLRKRFGIEEHNYSIVSRIIADTIQSGLIKDYDDQNQSKKYAKYVPFWA
ncbi:MAG: ATP-binding protein [Saprospiraceae bacterium]